MGDVSSRKVIILYYMHGDFGWKKHTNSSLPSFLSLYLNVLLPDRPKELHLQQNNGHILRQL